ncbi:MAG: RNA polymerase-binding protein DksA [Deltaproteobacteria bacterium]|nr:RNA polymerase-binding protein DksA [Deltaproteobacteria bacterium]
MEQEQLDYFRALLTDWLDDLLRHADETVVTMRRPEILPDPLDRASFDSERTFQLRIRDRESTLIKKIKNSLLDIENGTYGICRNCGERISLKRLEARPVAEHCILCKTAMEKRERLSGT